MDAAGRAEHLKRIERDETATERLNIALWVVVVGVSIYGLFIVEPFLRKHGIPDGTAWMLPTAVDAAFIISIRATGLLARHGVTAPWVTLLRWVSGLMALGLALAPTLATTPIKGGDVITHGFGPALLFFGVEGLAQFQVRMGAKLRAQREAVAVADRHRDDLTDRVRDAEQGHRQAVRDLTDTRDQLAAVTAELDAVRVTEQGHRTELDRVTATLTEQMDRVTAEHREVLRRERAKHAEALTNLRAELTTVSLTDRRRTTATSTNTRDPHTVTPVRDPSPSGSPSGSPEGSRLTDDDHLTAMLDVTRDPTHEWSRKAVRDLTGVGHERAGRLIDLWAVRVTDTPTDITAAAN